MGYRKSNTSSKIRIPDSSFETDDNPSHASQTHQERVRLSCLRVVPLLMKAIGWQGGSIIALETLKRVVDAGNKARDALVEQGLRVGLIEVLLGLLDWRAGGRNELCSQMKWNESEA
ncbi:hypothetical protein L2E82_44921 [Cichorium intybus]|uniref:Uncharacterized protein n=1 Tax=Cichorium intybus TaxID=13427 RepID=A0ACB8ZQK7_CICIN|nr:hypothetical protein L2E82_44921 [Cichorium intybus]